MTEAVPLLLFALVAVVGVVGSVGGVLWLRERRASSKLRKDLEHARSRAQLAAEARETFFDLATHELRSPLSTILGYQELLRDGAYGEFDDGAAEPLDRIELSARHLLHLIDGVVELSRLRSGDLKPDIRTIDLDAIVRTAAEEFRSHAEDRGIDATVEVPDPLPAIRSDEDRLVRALDLLVTSAIKHPSGGAMSLTVDALHDGARLTIDGTRLAIQADSDDPAVRLGIRLAVADRTAQMLAGQLELEPRDSTVVERIRFTVRDVPPTAT